MERTHPRIYACLSKMTGWQTDWQPQGRQDTSMTVDDPRFLRWINFWPFFSVLVFASAVDINQH